MLSLLAAPAYAQDRGLGTVPASRPMTQSGATAYGVNFKRLENAPWGALSADEKALRMNRDYDYPGVPTSDHIVVLPPQERDLREARKAAIRRYEAEKANFKAMSADERRAFIQQNRARFNAGYYR